MFRKHFNASTVIAIVALVFAMTGGAFAVTGGNGSHATAVAAKKKSKSAKGKGLRGPAGPRGATGPAGPAGPQGPAGAEGKAGANGKDGATGLEGKEGKAGTSVTSSSFAGSKGSCKEGGVEFKAGAGTPAYACNGAPGAKGEPWTAGGTLPAGATEKGTWTVTAMPVGYELKETTSTPISFPVPLAAGLAYKESEPENDRVHIIGEGGKGEGNFEAGVAGKDGLATGCPEASGLMKPEAEPGNLCVFEGVARNVHDIEPLSLTSETNGLGAGPWGSVLLVHAETAGTRVDAFGTWAVTG